MIKAKVFYPAIKPEVNIEELIPLPAKLVEEVIAEVIPQYSELRDDEWDGEILPNPEHKPWALGKITENGEWAIFYYDIEDKEWTIIPHIYDRDDWGKSYNYEGELLQTLLQKAEG